ncbi:MAG: TrmH family RNA methyltransferase [Pirellula sp.]
MPRGVGVRLPEWPLLRRPTALVIDLINERITSPSNPRVKSAARLRESRQRRRDNLFLIDGLKNISLALASGIQCTEIFVSEALWEAPSAEFSSVLARFGSDSLGATGDQSTTRWTRLTTAPMEKLQYGEQHAEAIAVAIPPASTLESLGSRLGAAQAEDVHELYLVLDRLEKPGNLGAAMRTADAVGATAVLLSDPTGDIWNPNAIRASLGAMFTVPLAIDTWSVVYKWLENRGVRSFAARPENGRNYAQVRFPEKTAIVIGNEAQGLGNRWQSQEIVSIQIPMVGKIDSLNASVTGAILLFEAIRQRQRA